MANIVVAYVLWFFFGWLGLHHFYLRRDRHAFVWWSSWGGFTLGWFRDLWRLPEYVHECNEDENYMKEFEHRLTFLARPKFNICRFAGELAVGYTWGLLVIVILPEDYVSTMQGHLLSLVLPIIGIVCGVHTVANIGNEKAAIKWPLIGALMGLPWMQFQSSNIIYSVLFSSLAVNWKGREWRSGKRARRHFCKRIAILSLCGCLYMTMWGAGIYLNGSIQTADGESVPLREAIPNFFKSPAWNETKETFEKLYEHYKVNGFSRIWEQIVESLDPTGETNAYKTLGLKEGATQEEITKRYRKLAREHHPDKEKDPAKKEEAKENFIRIQNAYEILSHKKSKRSQKSERSQYRESKKDKSWKHTEF